VVPQMCVQGHRHHTSLRFTCNDAIVQTGTQNVTELGGSDAKPLATDSTLYGSR
jgi:hypothetical protein